QRPPGSASQSASERSSVCCYCSPQSTAGISLEPAQPLLELVSGAWSAFITARRAPPPLAMRASRDGLRPCRPPLKHAGGQPSALLSAAPLSVLVQVHRSVLHHEADTPERGDVLGWVAVDGDDIGQQS